ncbi:MAG: cobalamin-binding protein [Betaproteobacteria bacterium]|nr:cobalamin-binding protein [Betaproteobacteria bacterium]
MPPHSFFAFLALTCACYNAHAEVTVRDDAGVKVRLAKPARRIVSLAPHVTENLYAAGAGERLVGAVSYSDFPEAVRKLPNVGGYDRPDLEAIVALKPDLVVGWQSGNPPAVLNKLQSLGIPVFLTEPGRLADIPANIEKLGRLAGAEAVAERAAENVRGRLADLRRQYAGKPVVTVFYQAWHQPLLTVGGSQIISDVIRLCGGENVFAGLASKAPTVSVEAVLAADPEVILASGMGKETPVGLDGWRAWPRLRAVLRENLFQVHPDLLQRPTPRLLDGAERVCRHLETARWRRGR